MAPFAIGAIEEEGPETAEGGGATDTSAALPTTREDKWKWDPPPHFHRAEPGPCTQPLFVCSDSFKALPAAWGSDSGSLK